MPPLPAQATSQSPACDWDAYYGDNKYAVPEFIDNALWRNYSAVLRRHGVTRDQPLRVLELGGANSCYFQRFCQDFSVASYTIVDSNPVGMARFAHRNDPRVTCIEADLLGPPIDAIAERHDIVLSSGLIEHFIPEETLRIVQQHFMAAKPGGLVLMSFPTPTAVYHGFRKFLEWTDQFPPLFERPIAAPEAAGFQLAGSTRLAQFNIWSTILTQMLLLYRK
jgi:hypothetical protein